MDALFIAKFIAAPSSFVLGSYNAVFSQNVMPHIYEAPASITAPMFTKVYYLGAKTIAPISFTAALAYGYLAYTDPSYKRMLYSTSIVLTFGTLVLTQTAMKPGIDRLIELSKDSQLLQQAAVNREVTKLLKGWVANNTLRAAMHITAGALGMYGLLAD